MKTILNIILVVIFTSCSNKATTKKIKGEIILSKNRSSYFYDMKINESYYIFLDDKSDTVMHVYNKNDLSTPFLCIHNRSNEINLINPFFTKEVYSNESKDTITIIDNHTYIKKIYISNSNLHLHSSIFVNNLTRSFDYNLTSKELYAAPFFREKCYPFYYFNQKEKYYWVDPSDLVKKILPNIPSAYIANICVNEENNTVVISYRFSNIISFYDLKGNLKNTIQIGENPVMPYIENNQIEMKKSIKCFISIAGTRQYVYCLYNGASDFSINSTVYVLNWDGKHITTWETDRNLRAISISKNNDTMLGISSHEERGQDIISYSIKNKL